ncbi:class I SAM-dependent DNA methyltransferase [Muricoccus pecuniae]|uniref:SAM-dependent methyltransferase n=1 Tax=Muricoccus pecuniae TaxID=693023 RepID=A0A840XTW8_9PROT|nr:class I SAM-dependent methyltransferase [Roseomonas pecuniae]MBB5692148.1 SAM-dependent methyltransferase [Roseomonas pecuniae]
MPGHTNHPGPVLDRDGGGGGSARPALYDMADLYDAIVPPGPCEAFYREEARRRGGPVLELACGTGRLTIPLAGDGHEVVGLDASRAMLAAASRKAAERGVAARFVLGDIRSFDLGMRFGLVIISCNSLAHLTRGEDLRACFAAVRRHLAPGGVLAFDVVRPDLSLLSRPEGEARRLDLGPNPASAIEAEEVAHYDPIEQVRISEWSIRRGDGARQVMAPLVLRQFFPQELPLLLEAGGLEPLARYGDFARNPLGPGSLNQILLARAAGRE